jgi:hypothetical protein
MEARSKQDTWNQHIHAWRGSGLSQVAYCARHGLKAGTLAYWASKQRKEAGGLTLVPLSLESGAAGPILYGATGWRLELPVQASPDWIADLLRRLP